MQAVEVAAQDPKPSSDHADKLAARVAARGSLW